MAGTRPTVGGDLDVWGEKVNLGLDEIQAIAESAASAAIAASNLANQALQAVADVSAGTGLDESQLSDYLVENSYLTAGSGDTRYYVRSAVDAAISAAQSAASNLANATGFLDQARVTGLESALSAKAPLSHTHTTAAVTGLDSTLASLAVDANVLHTTGAETVNGVKTFTSAPAVPDNSFAIAKVASLQSSLDGKAALSHAHAQSDVTGLTAALAGKSDTGHTHSTSQVTGLDTTLAGLVPTTRTVAGKALSSNVTLAKGDVGLGNVDNTSDANKPVSTAQQAAIDATRSGLGYYPIFATNATTWPTRASVVPAWWTGPAEWIGTPYAGVVDPTLGGSYMLAGDIVTDRV